ncbi:hypothetical protein [Wolbachia endosymbiont (group A) of Icerya purchasi]|uniref:hypothetical protein n=1 Tax=Wolbachia endosymbiont (group A) of Icerya purchasi TaxID=2954019 RepID=UPI00222F7BE9|nr:hypothetical protein [Wolbachia endosymbiont (group A) of Icerya purchasi]
MSSSISEEKENPVVTLRAQAEKFDFSKLRAGKDNAEANSGSTAFCDLRRMDFVINKKSTSRDLLPSYTKNMIVYCQKVKVKMKTTAHLQKKFLRREFWIKGE